MTSGLQPTAAAPPRRRGAVSVRAVVAERRFEVNLDVPAGQVVAVLGENGAGKSTLLHLVCGLTRPDTGRISIDGRVLVDPEGGVWVPPHRRGTVLLAQQPLLFPHLSAAENVAFGPRSRGASRRDAHAQAVAWLAAVDAASVADRRPGELSGGQAQRVAIARALATDPAVLLLDEPLAALDVALAPTLRQLLRRLLRESARTALLVTHDLLDALALADRVVVIQDGRVVEDGPARTVLSQPRSAFAARIAGVNLLTGEATPHGLTTAAGLVVLGLLDPTCEIGRPAVAVFRPNAVAIHLDVPGGSPRNHFPVTIAHLEPRGELVRVHAGEGPDGSPGLVADITAAAAADLDLTPGLPVHFAVKATEVTIYATTTPST